MNVIFKILICYCAMFAAVNAAFAQTDIPEEAKQAMQKGIAAVDKASSLEDLDEAITYFSKAHAAAPRWADACLNLARVISMKSGREKEAIKLFHQYLEIDPEASDKAEVLEEIKNIETKQQVLEDQSFMLNYIEFASLSDGVYVVGVNKPSRLGFRKGSKVLSINGKPTQGMSLAEFYTIMKEGPKDGYVCFKYLRPSANTPNVDGYLREALFDPNAPKRISARKNADGGYTNCIGGGQGCCE